jgi:hypothetical protein
MLQQRRDTTDSSKNLKGDGDASALMEEIILMRSLSNRKEPIDIVAVMVPKIETIAFKHGGSAVERSLSCNNKAQAGNHIKVAGKC